MPAAGLRPRWDVLAVVAVGGALGSLARYGVGRALPWHGQGFPWATFIENVSGGLALGVLMVLLLDVWPPSRYARPFLAVGLLGGYTTFSAYMLETRDLFAGGQVGVAASYLFGSLVVGLAAVWLGIGSARFAVRRARRRRLARDDDDPTDRNTDDGTRISP